MLEATLAKYEQVLGDAHPDTLKARNNLAGAYCMAGDLGRAVPMYEATIAQCMRVLGDTHPLTSMVQENVRAAIESARRPPAEHSPS
ncbi:tetratricopeptide repeat protein [Streptomyces sp. NPDC005283]|uniref:tetratricopeptide repeat protein n=1 Tax=Streptomyces sp. NPDC005283 TaxID=3156871 RepID=UPI003453C699